MRTKSDAGFGRQDGRQAIVGAVIAIVGVLAAANPTSVVLRALNDAAAMASELCYAIAPTESTVLARFKSPPLRV